MTSRAQALMIVASFVAGAILYGFGILVFAVGSYVDYYLGMVNQSTWWLFTGVLVAASVLFSGGLTYNWRLRTGPAGTTKGPRWVWGSLVVPLSLVLFGIAVYRMAPVPHCIPPPGIPWPTYCGGVGPSAQQTVGAFLLLVGSITTPAILRVCLSTRHVPLPARVGTSV